MLAVVRRNRIDISGVNSLRPSSWEAMLDELRSEYIPGQTPFGKRMLVLANGVFIFRINALFNMADTDIVRILDKYGIAATVELAVVAAGKVTMYGKRVSSESAGKKEIGR